MQTEDVDIVFMGGSAGDEPPTHEEVNAKRILLDDSMVRKFKIDFKLRFHILGKINVIVFFICSADFKSWKGVHAFHGAVSPGQEPRAEVPPQG